MVAEHDKDHPTSSTEEAPDSEHRPLGALAVVAFLTATILIFWYGMFFLNMVRN